MSGSTTKYAIPYPTGTDPVAGGDDAMKAIADRVDLMLGETGVDSITPSAANTNTTKRINYSRTYPTAPQPLVCLAEGAPPGAVTLWTVSIDTTGFTVGINSTSTAARSFRWVCRP